MAISIPKNLRKKAHDERLSDKKVNTIDEMVRGDVIFCATGITDGDFVSGIKIFKDYFESETFVLHKSSKINKKIKKKLQK